MGFDVTTLWKAPEVNPINRKARSVPGLNPFNVYGRVFFFSWFGFLIAFWSWYVPSPSSHSRFDDVFPSLDQADLMIGMLFHHW